MLPSSVSTAGLDSFGRTARLFTIVTLIFERDQAGIAGDRARGQLGRPEMARICGCDTKTIGRDIDLLRTLVQVDYDKAQKAYTLAEKSWRFPLTLLTTGDVLALALARGLLAAPGMPHAAAIRRALDKTTAALPPVLREILDSAADAFTSPSLPRDYSAAPVAAIMEATAARLTLETDYESRGGGGNASGSGPGTSTGGGGRRIRKIDPYLVAPRDGVYWELHGWCHENKAFRTFALDRVHGVMATSDHFPWRADEWARFEAGRRAAIRGLHSAGRPADDTGRAAGSEPVEYTVDIQFVPPGAAYARDHRWPPTLRVERESAGSEIGITGAIRLVGTIQSLDGMVAELLRWKRFARVLGGHELRAAYIAELRAMLDMHSDELPDSREAPGLEKARIPTEKKQTSV